MAKITIEVKCGNKTCKNCMFLSRSMAICNLFKDFLGKGLKRLPECIVAEVKE